MLPSFLNLMSLNRSIFIYISKCHTVPLNPFFDTSNGKMNKKSRTLQLIFCISVTWVGVSFHTSIIE